MSFFVEILKKETAEVLQIGEFENKEEAVACAKRAIDFFLIRQYEVGLSSGKLFETYTNKGEFPCIFRDGDSTINVGGFNHLQYAFNRCGEICGKP
jgi:hypothetical protein